MSASEISVSSGPPAHRKLTTRSRCWHGMRLGGNAADDAVPPQSLLTRDLRSITGQLRATCGYVWHLTDQVLASPYSGLKPRQQIDLRVLKAVMRAAESGALAIAESWRRRLSDLGGVTDLPGELAFIELKAALDSCAPTGRRSCSRQRAHCEARGRTAIPRCHRRAGLVGGTGESPPGAGPWRP